MSTGTLQRLEQRLHEAWHIVDRNHLVRIIMEAYDRLSADVDALTARNADLEQQLAAAQAKSAGTSDDKLNALADKIEAAMGKSSGTASTATPVVGSTATTVTNQETGVTTTVDHATGTATTTDASGTPLPTDHAAADTAKQAAAAAGVAVPGA